MIYIPLGKVLIVKRRAKGFDCSEHCDFLNDERLCDAIECMGYNREDGKNVYFKLVDRKTAKKVLEDLS